mgnify:CR=1 FL=1
MQNQSNEPQERIKEFLDRYGKLVEDLNVDFANYPMWVPDANGAFKCIVQSTPIDIKDRPTASPFVGGGAG